MGAHAHTDRRSLETVDLHVNGSRQSHRDEVTPRPRHAGKTIDARGLGGPLSSQRCAMTSRTNGHSEGQHQAGHLRSPRSALDLRRQEALERYLAGDPIEGICQELSCSKSWLYKWKKRYQVTDPDWVQEHSRRPQRNPTKTPDTLEAEIVWLRQALSPDGSGTVSADVIRDHLRQQGGGSIPSRRTIYRILKRQAREEKR
jgi:transposase-like protein